MVESISFTKTDDRGMVYAEIAPQIETLISGETDVIANLANVAAVLKQAFGFFWVGFYLTKGNQLVLGPFQGPLACTRIDFDKGVCGYCYRAKEIVIVPNVDEFEGHIACASATKSEIVLPVLDRENNVFAVLDVDSDELDDFSETDRDGLAGIVKIIEKTL